MLLFPKVYESASMFLGIDRAICVTGTISTREDDGVKLLANTVSQLIQNSEYQVQPAREDKQEVKPIEHAKKRVALQQDALLAKQVFVRVSSYEGDAYRRCMAILNIFNENANAEVVFYHAGEGKYRRLAGQKLRTSDTVIRALREIYGE